jgi:hypothetical protein
MKCTHEESLWLILEEFSIFWPVKAWNTIRPTKQNMLPIAVIKCPQFECIERQSDRQRETDRHDIIDESWPQFLSKRAK